MSLNAPDRATWKLFVAEGNPRKVKPFELPDSAFAYPRQRKLPLLTEQDVLVALEQFPEAKGVMVDDKEVAFMNIKRAAEHFGIEVPARNWAEWMKLLRSAQPAAGSPEAAA